MKKICLILCVWLVGQILYAQDFSKKNQLTVAFYNVENLFDTIDHPEKNDDEFTPGSEKKWNTERYQKKLNDLAKVLSSINPVELPSIIGLCEVENKNVVNDLVGNSLLKKGKYRIVHEESPDKRGIDVALVYRKSTFKYLSHKAISVSTTNAEYPTRDILYVRGKIGRKDILHLFVNHWSSRWGGQEKSEPNRIKAAETLVSYTDSILKADENAKIIIMGDFNDEPSNKSIEKVLKAGLYKDNTENKLFNLLYQKHLDGKGNYSYKGKWNMLDNLIVSKSLINTKLGWRVIAPDAYIHKKDWMLYENTRTGTKTPNRTYGGPNYYGGFSDHLPVFLLLSK